jgi:hypothetical protein
VKFPRSVEAAGLAVTLFGVGTLGAACTPGKGEGGHTSNRPAAARPHTPAQEPARPARSPEPGPKKNPEAGGYNIDHLGNLTCTASITKHGNHYNIHTEGHPSGALSVWTHYDFIVGTSAVRGTEIGFNPSFTAGQPGDNAEGSVTLVLPMGHSGNIGHIACNGGAQIHP